MKLISKAKEKEVNKLLKGKERDLTKSFLVFDEASINKAKELGLLKEAYLTKNGVVGIVSYLPHKELSNKVIYLDEISDPTNLGKIIYLMNKYNYHDLILSPKSVSIYNPKCLEVCKDLIFNINVTYGDINTLKKLKDKYQIVATGLKSNEYLKDLKVKDKFILVFGNESRGVNDKILSLADNIVKIKIDNIDSLNISVAASILLSVIK